MKRWVIPFTLASITVLITIAVLLLDYNYNKFEKIKPVAKLETGENNEAIETNRTLVDTIQVETAKPRKAARPHRTFFRQAPDSSLYECQLDSPSGWVRIGEFKESLAEAELEQKALLSVYPGSQIRVAHAPQRMRGTASGDSPVAD